MTHLSIDIPEEIRAFVESQVAQGVYPTVSDYLIRLIEEDRSRKSQERLEEALLEGIDPGPDIEATPEWRARFLAEATARHQNLSAR